MKKRIYAILLCLALVLSLSVPTLAASETATGIQVNQTKNLLVGDSKPLVLTATPAGAPVPAVTWSTSNAAVATVDQNGIVTGVKAGTVTITATAVEDSSMTASVNMLIRSRYTYNVDWAGTYMAECNNTITTAELPNDANRVERVWGTYVGNSTVMILDGYVYTYDGTNKSGDSDNGGTFYKINKDTGVIEDTLTLNASTSYYYAFTIFGGGLIYIGASDKVICVDPDSFTPLWTAEIPPRDYCTLQFAGNCVIASGTVLNSTTGAKVATLPGSYAYSAGAEKDDVFYIAERGGTLYALNTADWSVKTSIRFRSGAEAYTQPGVCCVGDRLYWGDYNSGNSYSIQLAADGTFVSGSLKTVASGICTNCTPVVANGRVYLPGSKDGQGVIGVFRADDMSLIYVAGGAGEKIQSNPIARVVTEGGAVVSSLGAAPSATGDSVTVYVQDYVSPSKIWMLRDTGTTTSGSLQQLVELDPPQWAYEQLAIDKNGAIYCSNDAGCLIKYRTSRVSVPQITENLSTTEARYLRGETAQPLTVAATVTDGGTLSYQWQSCTEAGAWSDIAGATANSYTPSTAAAGTRLYRCVITNTLSGMTASTSSKNAKITVVTGGSTELSVTFRLIGATRSTAAVDFQNEPGDFKDSVYQNWIPTTTFHVPAGTTVSSLISTAVGRANESVTLEGGAVAAVKAPIGLGAFTLANGDNGSSALWMLAVNGEHNASYGQELADGDTVLLHYCNDYRYEFGSEGQTWLAVEDVQPPIPAGLGDLDGDGKVNTKDSMLLARYLAHWTGVTIDEGKADVNGDGSVGIKDLMVIKRYLAHWEGVRLG